MSYLNAFVLVNKMKSNEVVATRCKRFSKYLRYIAIGSLFVFFILAAISTGQEYMIILCYIVLMISTVSALQSILLQILSKIYHNKK